jgi:hypothetical protein
MRWELLLVVPVLAVVAGGLWWHFARSSALLKSWAKENGYQILSCKFRLLFRGPFTWTTSEGQTVYRVTVEDRAGRRKSGWVRCGDFCFGLFLNKVRVRWDEGTPPTVDAVKDGRRPV